MVNQLVLPSFHVPRACSEGSERAGWTDIPGEAATHSASKTKACKRCRKGSTKGIRNIVQKGSEGRHSWNSLFLGSNAFVDAMADQYGTMKSTILDADSAQSRSLAVRMALGETQLVAEAREFLEKNVVKLDVFDQQQPMRSKTIILVKNLPFDTTSA